MADFIVEMNEKVEAKGLKKSLTWIAYMDGSSANGRSGAGVVFLGPNGEKFSYAVKFEFVATNNEAEYEAVLLALTMAREMRIMNLKIRSDSQIVVEQVNGNFATQEGRMSNILKKSTDTIVTLIG